MSAVIHTARSGLARRRLQALIMITHNPHPVARYTRRIIAISDGRVASDTSPGTTSDTWARR